jgi:hypothetical protein
MYGTTGPGPRPRPRGGGGDDNDTMSSNSSDSSTDFLVHPFQAFRPSLFSFTSPPGGNNESEEVAAAATMNDTNNTLPSLQDKSWIGARMSPIASTNDDEENKNANHPKDAYQYDRPHLPQHHPTAAMPFVSHPVLPPLAGHDRTEYPPFGIHPLQQQQPPPLSPMHAASPWYIWQWGTLVTLTSGLTLLGMGFWDFFYYCYYSLEDSGEGTDNRDNNGNNYYAATSLQDSSLQGASQEPQQHAWILPWGKPSVTTSVAWGALTPEQVLTEGNYYDYGRLLSSSLQCNSWMEWFLVALGWFLCQQYSSHLRTRRRGANASSSIVSQPIILAVFGISVITGQLWMLAIWFLWNGKDTSGNNYNNNSTAVTAAQCVAWGTCGVLCFVGMVRPHRRFGCFMICIFLVIVSLLQQLPQTYLGVSSSIHFNNSPLPHVVGCTTAAFCGWALFGSHLLVSPSPPISVVRKPDQLPIPVLPSSSNDYDYDRPQLHPSVRLACGILVMSLWMAPLLILAFLDYYY